MNTRLQPARTNATAHAQPDSPAKAKLAARGKFIFAGEEKFWVKGVTYGTFAPDQQGAQYPDQTVVEADFSAMSRCGINSLRTYTPPPQRVLDAAQHAGLRVMVGIAWAQHVAFLDDKELTARILHSVRTQVEGCARHPAVFCYAIGNEIPVSIVRWHTKRKIERFLERLHDVVKTVDPDSLVTYVNYPTTEYLELPFLDLVSFNVYLEDPDAFTRYLARLQNLAGERPLLLTEVGVDSNSHGELQQSRILDWQLHRSFEIGAAGAYVFSWTDEWFRGGSRVDGWQFGVTTIARAPKLALASVRRAFQQAPFGEKADWPMISVVVCSYNGAAHVAETLNHLSRLDYPRFEIIVVNDGSTDTTAEIASQYPVRLISTENRGLSAARNTGWQHAVGEIVAYIDDDAYPDPHWLSFLALAFTGTDFAAVGGPNIPPANDGDAAACVAKAPGGPQHVLITDTIAEHIPGCNMAFRRDVLAEIGGFDPIFRTAGDDVDACWKVQEAGHQIGFSPAAVVWHHRRNSLKAYWRQQLGYGRAEALLQNKWPDKYNALGHTSWTGRIYGTGPTRPLNVWRSRVYQGTWGTRPFQPLYAAPTKGPWALALMPEWYLLVMAFGALSLASAGTMASWAFATLTVLSLGIVIAQSVLSVPGHAFADATPWLNIRLRCTTMALHLAQPLARLVGRLRFGIAPWRSRLPAAAFPGNTWEIWRAPWCEPANDLAKTLKTLKARAVVAHAGGATDNWDIGVCGGLWASARMRMASEDHEQGLQHLLFRAYVVPTRFSISSIGIVGLGAVSALAQGSFWSVAGLITAAALLALACQLQGNRCIAALFEASRE